MRSIKIFSLGILVSAGALVSAAFINVNKSSKLIAETNGFAVVELFTSEGCSSCPPADALVAKIQKESKGKPVYILAFHVDYWNRLGWKDQFSNADFSKRQHDYANYLHLQSVYTPQIIVNGQTEFIGSQEGTLRNAIRTAVQKTPPSQLDLRVLRIDHMKATIKYNTAGTDKNTLLQVAIIEKAATSKVTRGENSGRTLSHVQIVRKLQQVVLNGTNGELSLSLPENFDTRNGEIIGLLQQKTNGIIIGATRISFSNDHLAAAAGIKKS